MVKRAAIRIKVDDPESGKGYCRATIAFEDGSVVDTPISNFSDLRGKAADNGLQMDKDVVANPATLVWLKDQEGWPDSETV
ncbi:MAG: hypothetical protein QOK28_1261 [Actinomycetota bacterium]|jgi:hypothetical protein